MKTNVTPSIILSTDSYKASHYGLYPPEVEGLYSYIESRGGKFGSVLFYGALNYVLEKYLGTELTEMDIQEARNFLQAHGEPFDEKGWRKVLNSYQGRLPLTIYAVPEGTLVPTGVPLAAVSCTVPGLFHLASYIETWVLRSIWYASTVATTSFMCKRIIKGYLEKTGDVAGLAFKLHDFGGRGVSSQESAMLGGSAHLLNFMGSDTMEGIWFANRYYKAGMAGFSIPALEHSVTTAWGKDREEECMRNVLTVFGGEGKPLACVSDTYDIFNAVQNVWGEALKEEVKASGATVVIRPDSGDPVFVVSKVMRILSDKFGFTVNTKGYKVLNNVRVIQGDGVNIHSIEAILKSLEADGFSADNIAFGMGGGLLQQLDRDTQKFAMKASAIKVGNEWKGIFKDPVTDPGKASKAGRVAAIEVDGVIKTGDVSDPACIMKPVYHLGEILVNDTFNDLRLRAESYL